MIFRFDFDLTNYQAWILVSDQLYKEHSNASKVVCKINVAPRDIRFVQNIHNYRFLVRAQHHGEMRVRQKNMTFKILI